MNKNEENVFSRLGLGVAVSKDIEEAMISRAENIKREDTFKELMTDISDILDEEIDIYGINNRLDDYTIDELRFIIRSFIKFLNGQTNVNVNNIFKVVNDFDDDLTAFSSGVFGTSFKTTAPKIYKELPSIQKLISLSFETNEYELQKLVKENKELRREIKTLKEEIDRLKKLSVSSTPKKSSYSSYGGCMGGSSSYGRC